MEAHYQSISKELVKVKTLLYLKSSSIKYEKTSKLYILVTISDLEKQLSAINKSRQEMTVEFQNSQLMHEQLKLKLKNNEDLLNTLTMGMSSTGEDHGFMAQLQGIL